MHGHLLQRRRRQRRRRLRARRLELRARVAAPQQPTLQRDARYRARARWPMYVDGRGIDAAQERQHHVDLVRLDVRRCLGRQLALLLRRLPPSGGAATGMPGGRRSPRGAVPPRGDEVGHAVAAVTRGRAAADAGQRGVAVGGGAQPARRNDRRRGLAGGAAGRRILAGVLRRVRPAAAAAAAEPWTAERREVARQRWQAERCHRRPTAVTAAAADAAAGVGKDRVVLRVAPAARRGLAEGVADAQWQRRLLDGRPVLRDRRRPHTLLHVPRISSCHLGAVPGAGQSTVHGQNASSYQSVTYNVM